MIVACVKAGHYVIIKDDAVVANIRRLYSNGFGKMFNYGYELKWKNGDSKRYKTLAELAKNHDFGNFPGYNAILKDRNSSETADDDYTRRTGRAPRASKSYDSFRF